MLIVQRKDFGMTELNRDQYESLVDCSFDMNVHIHQRYSGRSMYGDWCLGLSGNIDTGDCMNILTEALGLDLAAKIMADCVTDSLGMGTVFYFPGIKFDFEPLPSY